MTNQVEDAEEDECSSAGARRTCAEEIEASLARLPSGGLVVVDFDETLFLRNSTEEFLDHARPALLALLLTRVIERLARWSNMDVAARDWLRVVALTASTPWTFWRWRRVAPALGRRWLNGPLAAALLRRPDLRVVVATQGFAPIVAPILSGMDIEAELAATPLRGGIRARRAGKRAALERRFGADTLSQAVVITDNGVDDADIVNAAASAHVVIWPDARYERAFARAYVPLLYTENAKYPTENYIYKVILRRECVLLFIASALYSATPLALGAAFVFLALSFFTVFEIGHEENDRLGLQWEDRPSSSPLKRAWAGRVDAPRAWLAAMLMATPGLGLILWADASSWAGILPGWGEAWWLAFAWLLALWWAVLAIARFLFWLFNRVDEQSRLFIYFPLQLIKGLGLIAILQLPLAPLGGALLLAETISRWAPYQIYRLTGERIETHHQVIRLALFLALTLAVAGFGPADHWANLAGLAAFAWCAFRARRELRAVIKRATWLPKKARDARSKR